MKEVGPDNIPVSGSKAATKRKERLEFQVPPHDLDASLCHNLSENEAAQLTQYVEKIKENSVGQGIVVRVGNTQSAIVGQVSPAHENKPAPQRIVHDKILSSILSSQPIKNLLQEPSKIISGSRLVLSSQPLTADFENRGNLSALNKNKLRDFGVNTDAVQSFIANEPTYEKIFDNLKEKRVRFEDDCLLGPIHAFRVEYTANDGFKNDMQEFVDNLTEAHPNQYTAHESIHGQDDFNSPLPLKAPSHLRKGALMQQETPTRKINFGQKSSAVNLLPIVSAVRRDKILSRIFDAEPVRAAIYYPNAVQQHSKLIVSDVPIYANFGGNPFLSRDDKQLLTDIGVDTDAVQSCVVNGLIYDKLFQDLDDCKVDYSQCCLLQPMKALRFEYLNGGNESFRNNLNNLATALEKDNPICGVATSVSSDSGFDSQPPTPNYATHPLNVTIPKQTPVADSFNLVSLLETINDSPPPLPPLPTGVLNYSTDGSLEDSGERAEPLKAVTTCKSCKGDIYAGTVAVKAERAGKEVAWHPQCFKCHTCGDLLADLVYFFHGGDIYCGRDLANILKIPRCQACDELIFTKEYTAAEDATFHIKHFCCYQCDTPLAGQQYVPDDKTNMPLCLTCYDAFHAAKCQYCQQVIGPSEEGVNWKSLHWHKNCFVCAGAGCGNSLIGGKFCIKHDLPFCSSKCVATMVSQ